MEEILQLARLLEEKGIIIDFKANSIFSAYQLPGQTSELQQDIVSEIARKVTNDVNLFRQKINPLMDEYIKHITDEISKLRPNNEITKYMVKEARLPDIAKELTDKNISGLKGLIPETGLSFSTPTPENVKDMFVYGKGEARVISEAYVSQFTPAYLIEVWNRYLVSPTPRNSNVAKLHSGSYADSEAIILMILSLMNLRDKKPMYINMDDSTYSNIMSDLIKELKGLLATAIKAYDVDISTKKVIVRTDDAYTVIVNDKVYSEYLASNGRPEVVLGYLINGEDNNTDKYISGLLNGSDKYEKIWNTKYNISVIAAVEANVKTHKLVHILSIDKFLNELLPKDLESYVKLTKLDIERALEGVTKGLPDSDILDIDKMSRLIFGKIYFASTNYYLFTEYMLEYLKLFKDNDLKKAASFACLDVVLDYLLTQVQVTGA